MLFSVGVDICDTILKHGLGYAAPEADWIEGAIGTWIVWAARLLVGHWQASRTDSQTFHAGWAIFYLVGLLAWMTTLNPLGNR